MRTPVAKENKIELLCNFVQTCTTLYGYFKIKQDNVQVNTESVLCIYIA